MNSQTHRVLLVDDQSLATQAIKNQLERTGRFIVREENDSALALRAAREFGPDLILLDVEMPKMNGWEVARQIQGDKRLERVPVVFLTSTLTQSEALVKNSVDNFHFIAKPVPPSVLISILDWLLRSGAATADKLSLSAERYVHSC